MVEVGTVRVFLVHVVSPVRLFRQVVIMVELAVKHGSPAPRSYLSPILDVKPIITPAEFFIKMPVVRRVTPCAPSLKSPSVDARCVLRKLTASLSGARSSTG